ncbi:hypothetical protein FSP39_022868 [Pinctada imbricata]|uniref:ATP-dependent DNA helicase n=1 Tax=Pinctada imbricata TaxID=66713 RepID=A0AA88Y5A0_PINIB|nr:hypothetical protein FSP39_022868 [Pinctada imbricata]
MKAWQIHQYGSNEELTFSNTVRVPRVRNPKDILVKVHAASVNPIDIRMRGGYGKNIINAMRRAYNRDDSVSEFPLILGRDFSGEVVEVGREVKNYKPGDEVWGAYFAHLQGTHAEFAVAPSNTVSPKPSSLSHVEAASIPYVASTACTALCSVGELTERKTPGQRVLIHGGAGGIGTFAIQLMKSYGAEVTTTCSTDAVDLVTSLGADNVIDYQTEDVRRRLKEIEGFDVILDTVGGGKADYSLDYLRSWRNSKFVSIVTPLMPNSDNLGLIPGLVKSTLNLGQNLIQYNPIILRCLRANMDIQFITDVWACVAYITSYMCKPEKTMSELMRVACKEADTVKTKLKSIGNVFLKSREVSQHEAIARLVGLPLKETNTPVLFIPTGYKNQITRMIKPRYVLEKMKDDDTDIFVPNIIDKYVARPAKLEKMCLAEFSSIYVSGKKKAKDNDGTIDENDDVHTNEQIKLKDNLGILCRRKTPFVLRDYPVSKERDSEKFFHRLLLLYLPFRDESELEDSESFKTKFSVCQHTIEKNINKFEPYLDEVQAATEDMEQLDIDVEEIWERLAPQAEQNRNIDLEPGSTDQFLDPDNLTSEQQNFQHEKTSTSNYPKQHSVTRNITLEPTSKYEEMVRSLNQRQREIHDHIYVWCRQMALATSAEDEPPPFHIFLSGGAGVGKSHVVHTIYQSASRCLRKAGDDTELPKIVLTAPTGKAAVNIGGTTLHSAFHLPVKQRGQRSDYKSPSSTLLNTMRAMYLQMKILIIDEISMVGANTLSNLNLTLQNIFENDKPFGDKAVLAVGDLLQLNPVGEKAVYKQVNTGYAALSMSVWEFFYLFELDEIVRQKGDPEFANLLSRVRIGKQTESDITTLKSLEQNLSVPNDALSIFLTNELKDMYNNKQLDQLSSKVYTIKAKDTKRDLHSGCIAVNITSTNPHETGGLASEIQVALMAKYMLTKNVDISDGLVNGATGIIMKLDIPEKNPLQGTLYVKFDDPKVGKNARKQSRHLNLVPIRPISVIFALTEKSSAIQVERTQFPGTLAWGITVHKSQGSTFEQMVGDMTTTGGKTNTMPGQIYTMLSRAKSMKGLRLCSFDPDKIKINSSALSEMERLQSNKQLDTFGLHKCSRSAPSSVLLAYLNIRSLAKHCKDFADAISSTLGFVCLSETKVCRYSRYPFCSMRVVSSSNKYHGTVIYTSYEDAEELSLESELFELAAAIWNELLIVAVYVSPGRSQTEISQSMSELLRQIDEIKESKSVKRIIIIGDFNIAFGILISFSHYFNHTDYTKL